MREAKRAPSEHLRPDMDINTSISAQHMRHLRRRIRGTVHDAQAPAVCFRAWRRLMCGDAYASDSPCSPKTSGAWTHDMQHPRQECKTHASDERPPRHTADALLSRAWRQSSLQTATSEPHTSCDLASRHNVSTFVAGSPEKRHATMSDVCACCWHAHTFVTICPKRQWATHSCVEQCGSERQASEHAHVISSRGATRRLV